MSQVPVRSLDIVPGRATLEVMGLAQPKKDEGGVVQPETYLVAAGELLAFMFAVVWILSIIFNPGVVDSNPIKLKLGYNNFCVGLDTQPAKSPGLILFVVCYFVCIRYAVTNMTRSFERRRAGNIAVTQFVGSVASDLLWMVGISVFSLVWVIDPWMSLVDHTVPFCFFIVIRWLTILAAMLQSSQTTWRGWVFMAIYTPISFILPIYYLSSYAYFDATGGKHGTMLPWWVGMAMDYTWFACLPLTSLFLHVDQSDITAVRNTSAAAQQDILINQASLLEGNTAAYSVGTVLSAWLKPANGKHIVLALLFYGFLIGASLDAITRGSHGALMTV